MVYHKIKIWHMFCILIKFHTNSKGCFLANFNTIEEAPCETCPQTSMDGGFFPVGVDTYLPNEYGLYNTIGNVAEMTAVKGKAKGDMASYLPGTATLMELCEL